jgi:hypothetical protein
VDSESIVLRGTKEENYMMRIINARWMGEQEIEVNVFQFIEGRDVSHVQNDSWANPAST